MAYTAHRPDIAWQSSALRARIVGWGADLHRRKRAAVPTERMEGAGAHWEFPQAQVPRYRRERSVECEVLTPVFGTSCPPSGISGVLRRYAYTFSEGRLAHWALLLFADRVDVIESAVTSLVRGRPDNPLAELGLRAEVKRHGLRSRRGQHRADGAHVAIDILVFAAKGVAIAGAGYAVARGIRRVSA